MLNIKRNSSVAGRELRYMINKSVWHRMCRM